MQKGCEQLKVIKNNYNSNTEVKKEVEKTFKIHCSNCDSELEITEEDTHIGVYGAAHVTCPCCGDETMVDDIEGITLTKDNIEFPVHFYRTNKNLRNVKEIDPNRITNDIKRSVEYFRRNKDEFAWCTATGDTFLTVFRFSDDEEYHVVVSKDNYETYIPFEKEDYE